ncbi:MAG: DUF2147 domain-containing protein [Saprospiraceae bacterium]
MYRIVVKFLVLFLVLISTHGSKAQVTGLWKTIDDRDGSEKSVIEIYEQDGKLHGRVIKLLKGATYTTCENCRGDLKDKALVGMTIIHDLIKTPTGGIDGTVMDPNNGKTYSCLIELESPDKLRLRGYIGFPAFGRTQYWYRVQ